MSAEHSNTFPLKKQDLHNSRSSEFNPSFDTPCECSPAVSLDFEKDESKVFTTQSATDVTSHSTPGDTSFSNVQVARPHPPGPILRSSLRHAAVSGSSYDTARIHLPLLPFRPERDASFPWYLVWCDEKSHKSDKAMLREQLQDISQEVGAEFVALRKATKLAVWLEGQRKEYAIVTDWREAKPCVEMLDYRLELPRPFSIFVLCELRKQFDQACLWVAGREDSDERLLVMQSSDEAINSLRYVFALQQASVSAQLTNFRFVGCKLIFSI